jgi:uncharacterized repeat protein (TIGR01451 family)
MSVPGRQTRVASIAAALVGCLAVLCTPAALADSPDLASRQRLLAGQALEVMVEIDRTAADRTADAERVRRHYSHDDAAVHRLRVAAYQSAKQRVQATHASDDAQLLEDYGELPLALWRVRSLAALMRLEADSGVRRVHAPVRLKPVSVSDLGFISQPQVAAAGMTGAGTTIAVIDGGLGSNYLSYPDFGACTGVNTPATTCRVAYNRDFYPGKSTETNHGTNVSAIALGVAPGARLAMYDVFNGGSATSTDIIASINNIIMQRAALNIVAVNLSLGDSSSNAVQCPGSVFAAAFASLANAGISTIVAAGNSGSKSGLANPACVSGAISVGAVYDANYGSQGWVAPADPGGTCFESSAPDQVTCFSQSAPYLTLLSPGTWVAAPDPANVALRMSGTSQAAPHVSGALAVLRARYPREPLSQSLLRLTRYGVPLTDPGSGQATARLQLASAVKASTTVALAGTGPTQATAGQRGSYTLTATNSGPLLATGLVVTDTLPPGVTVTLVSNGCVVVASVVTCNASALASGGSISFTITVQWGTTGHVYDSAALSLDQVNGAPAGQQRIGFGVPPSEASADADGPLPGWSYLLLVALLAAGWLPRAARTGRHPAP